MLQKQFLSFDSDILCLQEIEKEHYESHYSPFMTSLGYKGITMNGKNKPVGNAIFYKDNLFTLQSSNERSRALIANLKVTSDENSKTLIVANVHLEGNPMKPAERFNQMKSLLSQIQKQETTVADQQIIICGDFNCNHEDGIYKMMSTGSLSSTEIDTVANLPYTKQDFNHPYKFNSAYFTIYGREPEVTFVKSGMRADVLDFVWLTNNLKVMAVEQLTLTKEELLPTSDHPSDHLPLQVTFA